jgi:hypothetical protein
VGSLLVGLGALVRSFSPASVISLTPPEQVFAAIEPGRDGEVVGQPGPHSIVYIDLYNNTDAPVYNAIVSLVFIQGAAWRSGIELAHTSYVADFQRYVQTIPPGRFRVAVQQSQAAMFLRPGAEVAYTDGEGHNWIRTAEGALHQIGKNPISYYAIPRPVDWIEPSPLTLR